ncbi:MAG: hypothetical protein HY835_03790 [Anaerolineae bacterium]|nr:hypothetical protein [Anaerolineae bacterium]
MGSNPIVASLQPGEETMPDNQVQLYFNPQLIEPYGSIPTRPALTRAWRILFSLTFTVLAFGAAVVIGFILRITGAFGLLPAMDPLTAMAAHALDVLISIPFVFILGPIAAYYA